MATPDGAHNELSFDSDAVADESDTSNDAIGDCESARSAWGMVYITWEPADTTSGADLSTHVRAAAARSAGGELNGVIAAALAEAPA